MIAKTETFAEDGTVRIVLENTGRESVTILKEFEPRRVFFQFILSRPDGTLVDSSGGGKVSLRRMRYVTLEPGEFVGVTVSLRDAFKAPEKGRYKLSVKYRNQYGVNCFRGEILSDTVDIVVEDSAVKSASARR